MPDLPWTIIVLIGLALLFDFLNGFNDSASIVATMIASRALSGRQALTITAIAEFIGPFLFGVAVATAIGHEVLNGEEIALSVVRVTSVPDPEARWAPAIGSTPR